MNLSPDQTIMFDAWGYGINATIVFTWVVMALLTVASMIITRKLRPDVPPNRWRTTLEVIVQGIQGQIQEIAPGPSRYLLYFAGTLFLFIATSNLLLVIPGFDPPTSSLSTTTALAISVLIAVPLFGVTSRGLGVFHHAAVQYHLGVFARYLAGHPALRKHHERGRDCRNPTECRAFLLSGGDGCARSADRYDPGLYLCDSGHGLHLWRHRCADLLPAPKGHTMTDLGIIAVISIFTAGLTVSFGAIGPALGEGRAASTALSAIAQQPDAASTISRTLFVSLAMIESTAIYCFVVAMILIFANPFWTAALAAAQATGN